MADQPSRRFKVLSMEPAHIPKSYEFQHMLDAMKDFYADMREELDILNARQDRLIKRVAMLQEEVKLLKKQKGR
jgi:hypothetical protein